MIWFASVEANKDLPRCHRVGRGTNKSVHGSPDCTILRSETIDRYVAPRTKQRANGPQSLPTLGGS